MTKLKAWFLKNLDLILGGIALTVALFLGHIIKLPGPVNKDEPRNFDTIEEFNEWYRSRFLGFWIIADPKADCDEYAEYLRREALKDGFVVSLLLLRDGMYYGVKVTDRLEGHCSILLLIMKPVNCFWYVEAQTGATHFIVNRD